MTRHPNLRWFDLEPDLAWYEDPGHGWLAVRLSSYPDAEQHATSFSFYIAAAGVRYVLLEEDVDAGTFLKVHPEIDRARIARVSLDGADGEQLRRLPRGTK
jgi:hypothetical protein